MAEKRTVMDILRSAWPRKREVLKEKVTEAAPRDKRIGMLKPVSRKSVHVDSVLKRRNPNDLEKLYALDPILFAGCNLLSSLVNSGWSVSAKNDKTADDFSDWLKSVKIDDKVPQIALHLAIHGNAWLENVFNSNKNLLADIGVIDPKTMDFEREKHDIGLDGKGKILVDDRGGPLRYVQRISDISGLIGKPDVVFEKGQITHITMRKVADSFIGIGVVEPAYKSTVIKMNIEEALGEAIFHVGFPTYVAKVGKQDEVEPTLEMMKDYSEVLADASSKTDFVIPWYVDLSILQTWSVTDLRKHLDHYVDMQIASLGVAKPFVLGAAEGANRATLEFLTEIGDRNVMALQKAIEGGINDSIAVLWAQTRNASDVPVFKFNALSRWDTKAHLDMMYRGIEIGAITPSPAVRKHIAILLNFPFVEGGEDEGGPNEHPADDGGAAPEKPVPPETEARAFARRLVRAVESVEDEVIK